MPITLTFETEEDLARFFENFQYIGEKAATAKSIRTTKAAVVKTPSAKTAAGAVKTSKTRKTVTKAPPSPKAKTKGKPATKVQKPGRKPGILGPVIQNAIQDTIKKGNPFKSRDVVALVMKRHPDLKESSVTTGVSKALSETKLKYEEIKDTVGRPYKLYKP